MDEHTLSCTKMLIDWLIDWNQGKYQEALDVCSGGKHFVKINSWKKSEIPVILLTLPLAVNIGLSWSQIAYYLINFPTNPLFLFKKYYTLSRSTTSLSNGIIPVFRLPHFDFFMTPIFLSVQAPTTCSKPTCFIYPHPY